MANRFRHTTNVFDMLIFCREKCTSGYYHSHLLYITIYCTLNMHNDNSFDCYSCGFPRYCSFFCPCSIIGSLLFPLPLATFPQWNRQCLQFCLFVALPSFGGIRCVRLWIICIYCVCPSHLWILCLSLVFSIFVVIVVVVVIIWNMKL